MRYRLSVLIVCSVDFKSELLSNVAHVQTTETYIILKRTDYWDLLLRTPSLNRGTSLLYDALPHSSSMMHCPPLPLWWAVPSPSMVHCLPPQPPQWCTASLSPSMMHCCPSMCTAPLPCLLNDALSLSVPHQWCTSPLPRSLNTALPLFLALSMMRCPSSSQSRPPVPN